LSARARLVLITDPRFSAAHTDAVIASVAAALTAGEFAVQLRDKDPAAPDFAARARGLRALTASLGTQLIINGPVELAREVGADGVHVPGSASIAGARRALGDAAYITSVAHDDDDVRRALAECADAVLVSPIFATPGKGTPRGVEALRRAAAMAAVSSSKGAPRALGIYALGGVDAFNAVRCFEAGASGVAVIRALLAAADSAAVARAIVDDRGRSLC
jgi:thiamine-phosphate pyrophosphorylase